MELIGEVSDTLRAANVSETSREGIEELMATLNGNLGKTAEHGKRADSIVKNMLLHSRQGAGERRLANLNSILKESLSLAYHGARAERQGFNITIEKSLGPEAGEVEMLIMRAPWWVPYCTKPIGALGEIKTVRADRLRSRATIELLALGSPKAIAHWPKNASNAALPPFWQPMSSVTADLWSRTKRLRWLSSKCAGAR